MVVTGAAAGGQGEIIRITRIGKRDRGARPYCVRGAGGGWRLQELAELLKLAKECALLLC